MDDVTLHIAEILDEKGNLKCRYARYMDETGTRWIRHGLFISYHPNGRVMSEGIYAHGAEDGFWRDFHATGALAAEGRYSGGREVGKWCFYDEDGILAA